MTQMQITRPDSMGWIPASTVADVMRMVQQALSEGEYGPFLLVYERGWILPMEENYHPEGMTPKTLLKRLMEIPTISHVFPSQKATANPYTLWLLDLVCEGKP